MKGQRRATMKVLIKKTNAATNVRKPTYTAGQAWHPSNTEAKGKANVHVYIVGKIVFQCKCKVCNERKNAEPVKPNMRPAIKKP